MHQICCITAAAKNALKGNSAIVYAPLKYENKIEFACLSKVKMLIPKSPAQNVPEWFDYCLKSGLCDLKVIAPTTVKDTGALGFSNTTQSSIVCYYKNSRVTYFAAQWAFNSSKNKWDVLYTEREWKDAPIDKPQFENNADAFKTSLSNIKDLAHNIDCDEFAAIFQKALDILSGVCEPKDAEHYMPLPKLPPQNLRLFAAADIADVFGAMGSWNDGPPMAARKKGLEQEFADMSNELLKQIRLAIFFAINQW